MQGMLLGASSGGEPHCCGPEVHPLQLLERLEAVERDIKAMQHTAQSKLQASGMPDQPDDLSAALTSCCMQA